MKTLKKPTSKQQRKRPKSVLAKAWETRRKNAAAMTVETMTPSTRQIDKQALLRAGVELSGEANRASPSRPSEQSTTDMRVMEEVRAFMADMMVIERQRGGHEINFPIMLSAPQARALMHFLRMKDVSPFDFH